MKRILTREEQRKLMSQQFMLALGLECKLRLLMTSIMAGDKVAFAEFQELIQHAPPELKDRLLDHLN